MESRLVGDAFTEHLNAEICLGNVMNFGEAVDWLKHTFMYRRMDQNSFLYNDSFAVNREKATVEQRLEALIHKSANELSHTGMIRFDRQAKQFRPNGMLCTINLLLFLGFFILIKSNHFVKMEEKMIIFLVY